MSYLFGGTRFEGYSQSGERILPMGGGGDGGGSPQPTQSTTQTSNIPEYAKPYVETMLGAAQQQVYNMDSSGNITGIKPYVPYSKDAADYVAPFSPLQTKAQTSAGKLVTPAQFGAGTGAATSGALGTMSTAGNLQGYGGYAQSQMTNPMMQRAYMSPYVENALAPTLDEMSRQYAITGNQERGRAAAAGAFGGTRNALMQAENERNKNIAMNKAIGEGYQQAFTQGQAAQEKALGMGLTGLQQAQSGYGQLGQIGTQLGQLGTNQLAADTSIIGTQGQAGAAQQTQQQNIINQAVQNYAMQQQYPQQQLGFLNSLLRGLPLQATQTQGYQAQPSALSQYGGLAATALGAYGASGGFKAKGGQIKEPKGDGLAELGLYNVMKGKK